MYVKESYFEIQLADGAGMLIPATLNCAKYWQESELSRRVYRIILRFHASEIESSDGDFFDAFCRVREQLEKVGLTPLCYGASRNVYPSGMGRDMGDGLQAYRMEIGHRGGEDALVSIFDSGPDIDPVSLEAQQEFFERWLKSFKQRVPGERAFVRVREFLNRWLGSFG